MIVDNLGFGKKVRALRSQKNLTLQEMAKVTKRSVSLLSQIETGKVSPSFSTMRSIADALDISLSQLIVDEEENEARDSSLMEVQERKVLTTSNVIPPGSRLENYLAMRQAIRDYGAYPLRDLRK